VVESTRLESERTGNRTVGSNPTLSASFNRLGGPACCLRAVSNVQCATLANAIQSSLGIGIKIVGHAFIAA
jgi:hypothetical protein